MYKHSAILLFYFLLGGYMSKVEIYTTTYCPYCVKAKKLLDKKGVGYEEVNVEGDDEMRATLVERTGGRRTVPQIFIDGELVGGCDDLHSLEASGKLDELLSLGK